MAAVSVCGLMNRMVFDHRFVASVRMAALGIWRAMEGAEMRVAPTLQQMRPLRGGPALQLA